MLFIYLVVTLLLLYIGRLMPRAFSIYQPSGWCRNFVRQADIGYTKNTNLKYKFTGILDNPFIQEGYGLNIITLQTTEAEHQ